MGYASPLSAKPLFLRQLSVSYFFTVFSESKFLYIQNTVSVVPRVLLFKAKVKIGRKTLALLESSVTETSGSTLACAQYKHMQDPLEK